MAWQTTEYFREKRDHPRVTLKHAVEALENAMEVQLQPNGRLRVWGYVEELDGCYVPVARHVLRNDLEERRPQEF